MKELEKFRLQLFAAPANETVSADVEPAISVDLVNRLTTNITELQNLLGIIAMQPMASGTLIKQYITEVGDIAPQVGEGEEIGLTKVTRKLAQTIELKLQKYRRQTTAEAIQKVGRNIAINETDAALVNKIRGQIKKDFYASLANGTGKATGTNLQSGLAAGWGAIQKRFEDWDATPIYAVSTDDIAEYLATAQVTLQTAFGFDYIENFLGLGTALVSPAIPKGTAYATARENLHGAYIPANGGDVAQTFNLTSDTTGLVGMTHQANTNNASVDTLILSGVKFFPEYLDGVIVIKIAAAGA